MKLHASQGSDQSRSHFIQFARVITREFVKDLPALARHVEDSATLVVLVDGSLDQVFALGAIDQFNGAVVPETEMARGIGDGNGRAFRGTGDLEQKLMLLRLQASGDRCIFAELEEFSQLKSKFRQGGEQIIRIFEIFLHIYIVSRYI